MKESCFLCPTTMISTNFLLRSNGFIIGVWFSFSSYLIRVLYVQGYSSIHLFNTLLKSNKFFVTVFILFRLKLRFEIITHLNLLYKLTHSEIRRRLISWQLLWTECCDDTGTLLYMSLHFKQYIIDVIHWVNYLRMEKQKCIVS